jgi:DNA-binding Lrp family transcriptional regulator
LALKDVELKLISELMRNSRRSDRELAKAIGTSQPTVTRIRNKLEKEGYLLEYTAMPNFVKLGYHLFALTFVSLRQTLSRKEAEEVRETAVEMARDASQNVVVIERGIGLGHAAVIGSFHKDYASYVELIDKLERKPYLEGKSESFLINLDDKFHYRHLTLATLAKHILTLKEKNE